MKIRIFKREIALLFITVLLVQIGFPAFGSSDSPSSVSYSGFVSTGKGFNVSNSTGAFTYQVPVTSIPEYPMSIAYSSGYNVTQDAGTYGIGFSGFSGAINRMLKGLPDDLNGAPTDYYYENELMRDFSLSADISLKTPGFDVAKLGLEFTPSIGLGIGYNTYTGVYSSISFGVGLRTEFSKLNLNVAPKLNLNFTNDSRSNGFVGSATAGLSISEQKYFSALPYSLTKGIEFKDNGFGDVSTFSQQRLQLTASRVKSFDPATSFSSFRITSEKKGNRIFSKESSNPGWFVPNLPNISPIVSSTAVSLSYPFTLGAVTLRLTGAYSSYNPGNDTRSFRSFGAMYLSNYKRENHLGNDPHLGDFSIENQITGKDKTTELAQANYIQKDAFNINVEGLSGVFEVIHPKYGAFSRPYRRETHRKIKISGVNTERSESYPWTSSGQLSKQKGLDILALLRKKETENEKDFDIFLFNESVTEDLTKSEYDFSTPYFKMRGEYGVSSNANVDINASSDNPNAAIPLSFKFERVPGTGDYSASKFLGYESFKPVYFPQFTSQTKSKLKQIEANHQKSKKTSTHIEEIKFDEIAQALYKSNDLLESSIYTHYKRTPNAAGANQGNSIQEQTLFDLTDQTVLNVGNADKISIAQEIADVSNSGSYQKDLVAGFKITSTDGLRYYFTLPSLSKNTKQTELIGTENGMPRLNGQVYYSLQDKNYRRNYKERTDNYTYANAWLLTAIVGQNYVDADDIPGPSEGDLGFWVIFKYIRTSDNFSWRNPSVGLDQMSNNIHTKGDDYYALQEGEKQIYVLGAVEGKNHVAIYNYKKRLDDPALIGNTPALDLLNNEELVKDNEIPRAATYIKSAQDLNNPQFAVINITLYQKHHKHNLSSSFSQYRKISGTDFHYSYSTTDQYWNNFVCSNKISPSSIPDDFIEGEELDGKLTLTKVTPFTFDQQDSKQIFPAYDFEYYQPSVNNAEFNPRKIDSWGNTAFHLQSNPNGQYHQYCTPSEALAKENAEAFQIKEISTPLGGIVKVEYEGKSYGSVEQKLPYVMRRVRKVEQGSNGNDKYVELEVLVTDIVAAGGNEGLKNIFLWQGATMDTPLPYNHRAERIKGQSNIYAEIAFQRDQSFKKLSPTPGELVVISQDSMQIVSIGGVSDGYQKIRLSAQNEGFPLIERFRSYMYLESEESQSGYNADLKKPHASDDKDNIGDAIAKMKDNFAKIFSSPENNPNVTALNINNPAPHTNSEISFIRTPIYKEKFSGTVVHQVTTSDEIADIYPSDIGASAGGQYTYYYDLEENGTGISSGVASIEPLGGKASVIDNKHIEGVGFHSSPRVYFSKLTSTSSNGITNSSDLQDPYDNESTSYEIGKTVFEYTTPADKGLSFSENFKKVDIPSPPNQGHTKMFYTGLWGYIQFYIKIFGKKIRIKIPTILPLVLDYENRKHYYGKSFTYDDIADYYGLDKQVTQYNIQGIEVSKTTTEYYDKVEPVKVRKPDGTTTLLRPGITEQTWSELYRIKEAENGIHWMYLKGKTSSKYLQTLMNYRHYPPILKSINVKSRGQNYTTVNDEFEEYTLTPITVNKNDGYGNTHITHSNPAFWEYTALGRHSENRHFVNDLKTSSASKVYLNDVDNNLVSESSYKTLIDVAKLNPGSSNLSFTDSYVKKLVPAGQAEYKFEFESLTEAEYIQLLVSKGLQDKKYLPKAPTESPTTLIVPNKVWTYQGETSVTPQEEKENAVFSNYNDFDESDYFWKRTSWITKYNSSIEPAETKDILNKASSSASYNVLGLPIFTTKNSGLSATIYSGAEMSYVLKNKANQYTEDSRLELNDARPVRGGDCPEEQTISTIISANSWPSTVHRITLVHPQSFIDNKPLNLVKVTTIEGAEVLVYFYFDESGRVYGATTQGNNFSNFLVIRKSSTTCEIYLNPQDFSTVEILEPFYAAYHSTFYDSYKLSPSVISSCLASNKQFTENGPPCVPEAHAGDNLFLLPANSIGTIYRVNASAMQQELGNRVKALVWVHKDSPEETKISASVVNTGSPVSLTTQQSTDLESATIESGQWKLLRLDIDLSNISSPAQKEILVFVSNTNPGNYAFYDDFKVQPYGAMMSSVNYDPKYWRTSYVLDDNHFYSKTTYDEFGRVSETFVEVEGVGEKRSAIKKYGFKKLPN